MKVLVTGATGFLGGHLIAKLVQQGDEVRALARKTSKLDHLLQHQVEVVHGDLKDGASLKHAVKGVDIVYHLGAATSGVWEDYQEGTVKGTERMLELALEAGVKRFVHISSLAVYQVYGLEKNTVVNEAFPYETTPERVGPYTYSKVEAEKLVFQFYKRGLPIVVVRPGIIYGPRGKIFFPHIGRLLRSGLFIMIGKGDYLLPLTYVDNTVDAILLAGTGEEAIGKAYNIVDDGEITQREYLGKYMQATHAELFTLPIPFSLLLFSATLATRLRSLGLFRRTHLPSKYSLVSKWHSLRFDTTDAKQQLNWQPKVSLEEGLRRTFEWYVANGKTETCS